MKRIIALTLILMLLLSGCGVGKTEAPKVEATQPATTEATTEPVGGFG